VRQRPEGFGESEGDNHRDNQDEEAGAVAGPKGPQPVLLALGAHFVSFGHWVACAVPPETFRTGPQVAGTRLWSNYDSGAGQLRPPAQVEILAWPARTPVEAAQRPPKVRAHENRTAWRYEHLPRRIVLTLVQLARFDERVDDTQPVCTQADRCQPVRGVPHDELRAGQACIASVSLLQEEPDGVGLEHHVVVADQDVSDLLDHFEPFVDRVGKSGPLWHPGKVRLRGYRCDPVRDRVVSTDVDHEHRQVCIVLRRERNQCLVQPRRGTAGHDHRNHARRGQLRAHQRSLA